MVLVAHHTIVSVSFFYMIVTYVLSIRKLSIDKCQDSLASDKVNPDIIYGEMINT